MLADRGVILSGELLQQRFSFLQIYGIKPLAEPSVNLREHLPCCIVFPLLLPEATQAHRGA